MKVKSVFCIGFPLFHLLVFKIIVYLKKYVYLVYKYAFMQSGYNEFRIFFNRFSIG